MLYIFDKDDNFINIITEETGLIDTWFKDYQNHLIDESFKFHVGSESELLPLIVAENQVAFYDRANRLRMMRLKEPFELYDGDGYVVEVMAEPSWLELHDHFVEDRRVVDGEAQTALNRALDGSRYTGDVQVELGLNTTNFYWIDAVEAIFKIIDTWGGSLVDTIELDENNEIIERNILIVERLGADNGLLIQPDYNAETIERRTLSYSITAMYGQGASLEIEDDEGELTGGHTRYITFEDVEWKVSNGDPVDKPLGQKWVGDPEALAKYGYLKDDGSRMHRFGHFSNQDYETPEEVLKATWQALQEEKEPEVYHEAVIDEVDKDVFLGDTATILDRHYGKSIEVQSQLTGIEYDILEPNENVKVVVGNYKDMSRDPLEDDIDEIKKDVARPPIINDKNFPDVIPGTPVNVEAVGMFRAILISWEYDSKIYMSHYEVFASQNQDFVPDDQFLVYRGRVSSFGHEVGSNKTWYYRVRAVNMHGTTSDFSVEVSASSTRIDFIDMKDEIKQEIEDASNKAEEAYDNANLATQNAIESIGIAQESFDKAQESLDGLTTLYEFKDETTDSIASIKGDVQGLQTTVKDNEDNISTLQQTVGMFATRIEDAEGNISSLSQTVQGFQNTVSNMEGDISQVTQLANTHQTKLTNIEGDVNELTSTASSLVSRIENAGGRNLISNSRGDNLDDWIAWSSTNLSVSDYVGSTWIWAVKGNGNQVGLHTPTFKLKANETYTISFTIRSRSNSGYQLNYLYLRQGKNTITTVKSLPNVNMSDSKFKGDIAGDGLRVWFTFSHNENIDDARILLAISDRPENAGFVIRESQIEQSEVVNDWLPAPEDISAEISSLDNTVGELGLYTISEISQLNNAINLRVQKGDVMSQLNIESGRTLLQSNKIILDAETTTVTGNFRVNSANIASLDAGKLTGGTADFAKFNAININANSINGGTIDTDLLTVRGGSTTDYTMIDGSHLTARGRFRQTWKGNTRTYDIRTMLQDGYLRFRNDSEQSSLYYSWYGISTYVDGEGGDEGDRGTTSGSIYWWDTTHSQASPKTRGITVYSYGGTAALESDRHHALVKSRYSTSIESTESSVNIVTHSDSTQRSFTFTKSTDRLRGYLLFGDNEQAGLRFSNSNDGIVQVVDVNNETGGNTEIEAGYGTFNTIRRRSGSNYLNLQNANYMMIGLDNSGSARIASNVIYRRTYSSGANVHITGSDTLGRSTSARKYKRDIEPITKEFAYNFFDNVTPIYYRPFNTDDENMEHSHYGYIADDVAPIEPRLVQFRNEEPESFNYDRVPTLLHVVLKNEVKRIDELENIVETQQTIIENLQLKIAKMESAA